MKNFLKMAIVVLSMTISLNAQTLIKEDVNVNRIETGNGFFYVDDEGIFNGPYMNKIVYPDGSIITISGVRRGSKNVGRKLIKLNGKLIAIRVYDRSGVLIRSTRIKHEDYRGLLCEKS